MSTREKTKCSRDRMGSKTIACFFALTFVALLSLYAEELCEAQEKYVIRFQHEFSETHHRAKPLREWANLVEERSKGALKFEIYLASQLFKPAELVRAVQMGAVEAGNTYTFNIANSVPQFNIFSSPFMWDTTEQLMKTVRGEIGEILNKYAEEKGIKALGYLPYWQEAQCLVSRKPLKVPSDCKGIMVRVNDDISAKLIKLWGGGGSYMAAGELYMALQRGTLNGAFANLPTSVERKWYEVAPYSVLIPYYAVCGVPFINKAYFYKLPKELQQILLDTSAELEKKSVQLALEHFVWGENFMKEKGYKPYTPTPEEKSLWEMNTAPIGESLMKDVPGGLDLLKKVKALMKKG
jgi:TRAP-type C4-dicarboxylate transport system substrate-binding protein